MNNAKQNLKRLSQDTENKKRVEFVEELGKFCSENDVVTAETDKTNRVILTNKMKLIDNVTKAIIKDPIYRKNSKDNSFKKKEEVENFINKNRAKLKPPKITWEN